MMWLALGVVGAIAIGSLTLWLAVRVTVQLGSLLLRLERAEERVDRNHLSVWTTDSTDETPHVIRSPLEWQYMRDSDEKKPTLLYICPVIPAATGSGIAMRAGSVLRLLARHYRVWLLATPFSARVHPLPLPFADLCEEWAIVPLEPSERETLYQPWESLLYPPGRGTPVFWNMRFDIVHVFRLYSWPVARFYLPAGAARQLDLDDVESRTHGRHAELRRHMGDLENADVEEDQAERYRALEDEVFSHIDRVLVCSEEDRREISGRTDAHVSVLPNTIPIPQPEPRASQSDRTPFRFLFIGSLEYFPNREAVRFFALEVMPSIRRRCASEIVFTVAGSGSAAIEDMIADLSNIEVVGQVSDVRECFERSHALVTPLASGGGTRIKILEAFSFRRPVISTSLGAEGIDARDGEEILIGNTPEAFADQCIRLIEDPALSERLTGRAFALLRDRYTLEAVERTFDFSVSSVRVSQETIPAEGSLQD